MEHKACTKCNEVKELNLFKHRKNGKIDSWCKSCYSESSKKYYIKNKEVISDSRKTDDYKKMKSVWDLNYRTNNREHLLEKKRNYYHANRDINIEKMRLNYANNSDAYKQRAKCWKQKNRSAHNAKCMERYTVKINRCLAWSKELTDLACKEAYDKARMLFDLTGIKHDVDHIVPLMGKTVSGLHIYNNLQVIPASENRSKGHLKWPGQ